MLIASKLTPARTVPATTAPVDSSTDEARAGETHDDRCEHLVFLAQRARSALQRFNANPTGDNAIARSLADADLALECSRFRADYYPGARECAATVAIPGVLIRTAAGKWITVYEAAGE